METCFSHAINVFYKHKYNMEHLNENMEIKMEITRPYKDALSKQANEAVRICNRIKNNNKEMINSKSNSTTNPPISRLTT